MLMCTRSCSATDTSGIYSLPLRVWQFPRIHLAAPIALLLLQKYTKIPVIGLESFCLEYFWSRPRLCFSELAGTVSSKPRTLFFLVLCRVYPEPGVFALVPSLAVEQMALMGLPQRWGLWKMDISQPWAVRWRICPRTGCAGSHLQLLSKISILIK